MLIEPPIVKETASVVLVFPKLSVENSASSSRFCSASDWAAVIWIITSFIILLYAYWCSIHAIEFLSYLIFSVFTISFFNLSEFWPFQPKRLVGHDFNDEVLPFDVGTRMRFRGVDSRLINRGLPKTLRCTYHNILYPQILHVFRRFVQRQNLKGFLNVHAETVQICGQTRPCGLVLKVLLTKNFHPLTQEIIPII